MVARHEDGLVVDDGDGGNDSVEDDLAQANHTSGCDGHCSDRFEFTDGSGTTHSELWRIDDMGHDWAGGSASRIYTPEATKHMFDFYGNWSN